jgi:opacity protein-like surface antigen
MKQFFLLTFCLFLMQNMISAQETDLLGQLEDEPTIDYATASFKTSRIVNGHTIENALPGTLDFKINHRFSPLKEGFYDLFGLDGATIRFGLDYGISDRLMVGLGRNSYEKIIDGFVKYKILRQSTGKRNMPITLCYLADMQVKTERQTGAEVDNKFTARLYYTHQLLLARKFSAGTSLQLMPTLIHRNFTTSSKDKNQVLAMGIGGRQKLTKRVAINLEYYYVPTGQIATPYKNSLSIGFDIETGGHVFQLHFTNSNQMSYKGFITETSENWFGAGGLTGVRFGFNISRSFTIVKPKGLE